MPPASASRAGVTPEASRDRSSGTFGKKMKLALIVVAAIIFPWRVFGALPITQTMMDDFSTSLSVAVASQSIESFQRICSNYDIDTERKEFMRSARIEILKMIADLGPNPIYNFQPLNEPPYKGLDMTARLITDRERFRDIPTRPVAIILEISERTPTSRFPKTVRMPLVIEDNALKHLAWKREYKQ